MFNFLIFPSLFLSVLSSTTPLDPTTTENDLETTTKDYTKLEIITDFLLETTTTPAVDYCKLCRGKHTMCQYPNCTLSGNCTNMEQRPLRPKEKEIIVMYHNKLRNLVAKGQLEGQPGASNMNQLEWDEELERIAQCWANQCIFEHDECRDTETDHVGQNIAYHGSTLKHQVLRENLKSIINDWFNEYKDFPPEYINSRPYPNPTFTGHYTQMVWAETKRIGCARVYAFEDPFYTVYLYCNYAPRGNVANWPVYKIGNATTKCEVGRTKSTLFSGLCDEKY